MSTYTIADLERLSGIKAHTIRIWEQRYKALTPYRTPGNTRYYSDSQLKQLLNVVTLSKTGKKISELFSLSKNSIDSLLQEQIEKSKSIHAPYEYYISEMILAGLSYREPEFDKLFSAALSRYEMKSTYINIIYPLLVRIGLIWSKDDLCPAQEHFVSNLIRQKILTATNGLSHITNKKKTWVLFLPEGEYHDIGLLFSNYIIRLSGQKTIYLGANVPMDSLKDSIKDIQPTDLLFSLTTNRIIDETETYFKTISLHVKNSKIHLTGNKKLIEQVKLRKNINWIQSVGQLEKTIA